MGINSAVVNLPMKLASRRERPDRDAAGVPEGRHVPMPTSTSFPSGHSASAFAFADAVAGSMPVLGALLRGLAAAAAYSRVHMGVHYPGDVIVGSVIGATIGETTALGARALRRRHDPPSRIFVGPWTRFGTCVDGFIALRIVPWLRETQEGGWLSRHQRRLRGTGAGPAWGPRRTCRCGSLSFADTAKVLKLTRAAVAWMAVGCGLGAYEHALAYAKERDQFGRPVAGFQLVQDLLVRMLGNCTTSACLCLRLAQLAEAGEDLDEHSALAKTICTVPMRETVGWARELIGGNGILLDHRVGRFVADAEALYSYEGTRKMNTLIVGRSITGISAFA